MWQCFLSSAAQRNGSVPKCGCSVVGWTRCEDKLFQKGELHTYQEWGRADEEEEDDKKKDGEEEEDKKKDGEEEEDKKKDGEEEEDDKKKDGGAKEDGDCGGKDFPRGSWGGTTLVGTRPRPHS